LLIERKYHVVIINALQGNSFNTFDLLICIKSFLSQQIASSILAKENLIPVLFSLLTGYRSDDVALKQGIMHEGYYVDLPKLSLLLEVLRIMLGSGFVRQNDDANIYSDIINELNMEAFGEFFGKLIEDKLPIIRSHKNGLIMYMCERNVGNCQPGLGKHFRDIPHHEEDLFFRERQRQDVQDRVPRE
jgi:hypothetical protein